MFDKIKDHFERALAAAINKVIDPNTSELKNRNSYLSNDYPSPSSRVQALEEQLKNIIGYPDGWINDEEPVPIFAFPMTLTKQCNLYAGLTPSIQAKESLANREMIGQIGTRQPQIAFDSPELTENRSRPMESGDGT